MVIDVNEAIKKEALRRGYSFRTIKSYQLCVEKFLETCNKTIDKISKKDVKEYLDLLVDRGKAGNTINVNLNALKFLFEKILGKKMRLDIKYSKKPLKLPVVLSKEEVKRLFSAINNEKHKLMIQLLYSAGLRVSELINLKPEDLKLEKSLGWVRGGKGNKDRLFIIADSLKTAIKELIGKENLSGENFLFNSNRDNKYDIRSLQVIIKQACKKAKLDKGISCHSLRHSFATHLLENGYKIHEIQLMLGHKSPETTFTYLRTISPKLLNIKSPIDSL